MNRQTILSSDLDVRPRLAEFGLEKQELIDVALAAIAARNDAVAYLDPCGTAGMLSYIYGTRALRRLLLSKGWRSDRHGHIEGAINNRLHVKFVFQNTFSACDDATPRAISGKGPAAREQVEDGQGSLFPDSYNELPITQDPKSVLWFFCAALRGDEPVAELLCPRAIQDRQFYGYVERVFILKPGDLPPIDADYSDSPEEPDLDVPVTKKV